MITINKNKIFLSILLVFLFLLVFGGGFYLGQKQVVCPICPPENLDFSLFWEAYNKLQTEYIDPSRINTQDVIYGAIAGMTDSLKDPYSTFFNPEEANRFAQDLSGSFEGIGVEVGLRNNQLTIVAPLKGTPGEKAGLKPGDVITKIDGKDATDMSVEEAVKLIRGKGGTEVTLSIFRKGWSEVKDIKITRETIVVPTVEWELKNGDVAYIEMYQFGQTLPADFNNIAMEILKSPAKKIVLDLRNNPGGYLEVAQDIAGWFLKKGQIVTIESQEQGKEKTEYKAEGNATFAEYPIVVLINDGSASASEILAGALKDNRKVKLVGKKSFGKGSVQEIVELRDGSMLKITIAKWLTPKGTSISEVGLTPDIKVDLTEKDFEANRDPQLDKALEIIKNIK